jgi:trk system potassium uptake protein TrkA
MYAVVCGVGQIAYHLARDLTSRGHEVTIVSRDHQLCEHVKERCGCSALEAFSYDPAVLTEAGIERADVLVACELTDEENLVVCHVGKVLHPVVRTVALIRNPENDLVYNEIAVDVPVNTTMTLVLAIEQKVTAANVIALGHLQRTNMDVIGGVIDEASTLAGRSVGELNLPPGVLLISIVRGEELIVPHGATVLHPGDEIIALAEPSKAPELTRQLSL